MSTARPAPDPANATNADGPRATRRTRPIKLSGDKDFMASLAKGLAVLRAFSQSRPTLSLTEAAAIANLSRAAARRVLLTLSDLGYVAQEGRDFTLTPLILELGFSYLSVQSWVEMAEPRLKDISAAFNEASFAANLFGSEATILARAVAPGAIMSSTMAVGARLPAFHSALGRILLGYEDEAEIWERLRASDIRSFTTNSITDPRALVERVQADTSQGFSIVDEELERGLRAIAVPVVKRNGTAVGAISLTAHASRTTRNEMRERYLPALREAADEIAQGVV